MYASLKRNGKKTAVLTTAYTISCCFTQLPLMPFATLRNCHKWFPGVMSQGNDVYCSKATDVFGVPSQAAVIYSFNHTFID